MYSDNNTENDDIIETMPEEPKYGLWYIVINCILSIIIIGYLLLILGKHTHDFTIGESSTAAPYSIISKSGYWIPGKRFSIEIVKLFFILNIVFQIIIMASH